MYTVEIRHNFETAHRLSSEGAPVKCQSIHGHSWWVTIKLSGDELDERGMLIEFGAFKKAWRKFLDDEVDHHLCVVEGDPLAGAIREVMPEARILEVPFDPTTENLARWLCEKGSQIIDGLAETDVRVAEIHLQETRVNAVSYRPGS